MFLRTEHINQSQPEEVSETIGALCTRGKVCKLDSVLKCHKEEAQYVIRNRPRPVYIVLKLAKLGRIIFDSNT